MEGGALQEGSAQSGEDGDEAGRGQKERQQRCCKRAVEDGFERVGDDDVRAQAEEQTRDVCADEGFAEKIFAVVGKSYGVEINDALA